MTGYNIFQGARSGQGSVSRPGMEDSHVLQHWRKAGSVAPKHVQVPVYDINIAAGTKDPLYIMCFAEINMSNICMNNVQPVNHQDQQPFIQYVVRVDSMEFLELLQRQLWRWA